MHGLLALASFAWVEVQQRFISQLTLNCKISVPVDGPPLALSGLTHSPY
jgi:hypothetical protein